MEDTVVLEYLAALGCIHAQGYAIARPFPAEALTAWIGERAARR